MRSKRFLIKFVCCILMLSLMGVGLFACNNKEAEPTYTVSVDVTTKELTVGESFTLTATTNPKGGKVVWESSKDSIATVNNGVVEAKAVGSAVITAKCGKNSASCSVTVKSAEPTETYYTVTFKNGESTVKTVKVLDGGKAAYTGVTPSKASTAENEFSFIGWSLTDGGDLVNLSNYTINNDTTFYAIFSSTVRSYTVTWNVEGVTSRKTINYGATPNYTGLTPTKKQSGLTVYTFAGWSLSLGGEVLDVLPTVTGNVTFYAVFNEISAETEFDITWKNGDNTLTTSKVKYGNVPTYNGETPVKADTTEYSYEFIGWALTDGGAKLDDLPEITSNATFYAVFNEVARKYSITWDIEGATVVTQVAYGTVPSYVGATPIKADSSENSFKFVGWSNVKEGEVINKLPEVSGEATYFAIFEVDEVFEAPKFENGKFMYSNVNGKIFVPETLVPNGASLSSVVLKVEGEEDITVYENDAWVKTNLALTDEQLKENKIFSYKTIAVLSNEARYTVDLDIYAGVIETLTDMANFFKTEGTINDTSDIAIYGYYVIINDLGSADTNFSITHATGKTWERPQGFCGVLDGLGHTLRFNLNGSNGLFGEQIGSCRVRNTAFIFSDNTSEHYGLLGCMVTSGAAVLENCYVEQTNNHFLKTTTFGVLGRPNGKLIIENTIIYGFNISQPSNNGAVTISAQSKNAFVIHARANADTLNFADNFVIQNDGKKNLSRDYAFGETDVTGFNDLYWSKEDGLLRWKGFDVIKVTWIDGEDVSVETITKGSRPDQKQLNIPAASESSTYSGCWSLTVGGEALVFSEELSLLEDTVLYSVYKSQPREYTVTWNIEGKESSKKLAYGSAVSYDGTAPTKASTASTVYTFAGWSLTAGGEVISVLPNVTGDVTYYAVFSETPQKYTVTWNIEGVTSSDVLDYGTQIVYSGKTPTKESSASTVYTFAGWAESAGGKVVELPTVTKAITYFAVFSESAREYTITWDIEGAESTSSVAYGTVPAYTGTPTKAQTTEKVYTFAGWASSKGGAVIGTLPTVTGEAKYFAIFTESARKYAITWNIEGAISTSEVAYGTVPNYDGTPFKDGTAEKAYVFAGWASSQGGEVIKTLPAVTGEATYYAIFGESTNVYTITWNVEGIESTTQVAYGSTPQYTGVPTKDSTASKVFTFAGWSTTQGGEVIQILPLVTGEATYFAIFTESTRKYTITWNIEGITSTSQVEYDTVPSFGGETPTKESTASTVYTFAGWASVQGGAVIETLPKVSGDITYFAVFTETTRKYAVTWNIEGAESSKEFDYGATPSYDGTPSKKEDESFTYEFSHWSLEKDGEDCGKFAAVVTNITYFAVFTKKAKLVEVDLSESVLFSTNDNKVYFPASLNIEFADVESITSVDDATVYYDGSKWLNSFALTEAQQNNNEVGKFDVVILAGAKKYIGIVNSYTEVLDEFSDFERFYKGSGSPVTVTGSYALANDVGSTTLKDRPDMCATALSVANNFNGFFDGLGHTVAFKIEATYNKQGGYFGGLFGRTVRGTIKNVNFDVNLRGSKGGAGVIGFECDTTGSPIKTYLENVNIYIYEYALWGNTGAANKMEQNVLFQSSGWGALSMKNMIIEVVTLVDKTSGALKSYNLLGKGGAVTVSNVYLIKHNTSYDSSIGNTNGSVTGIPVFDTLEDLKNSGKDFSGFTTWDLTKGYPVFKKAGNYSFVATFVQGEISQDVAVKENILYSTKDKQIFFPTSLGLELSDVESIKSADGETTYYDGSKWVESFALTEEQITKNEIGTIAVKVKLSDKTYAINVKSYAGIIDELSDLATFFATEGTVSASNVIKTYGYYIVIKNLGTGAEIVNVPHATGKAWAAGAGFNGVLDGLGHELQFTLEGSNGIFGEELGGFTVKNASFIFTDHTTNSSGLFGELLSNSAATVENCYFKQLNNTYADGGYSAAAKNISTYGIVKRPNGKLIVKNCVIFGNNFSVSSIAGNVEISSASTNAFIVYGRDATYNIDANFVKSVSDVAVTGIDLAAYSDSYWSKTENKPKWKNSADTAVISFGTVEVVKN